jgi:hypothetical protein
MRGEQGWIEEVELTEEERGRRCGGRGGGDEMTAGGGEEEEGKKKDRGPPLSCGPTAMSSKTTIKTGKRPKMNGINS